MTTLDASLIIPTYNRKQSLVELLDSLTKQTIEFNRFEVIVVDDDSTDGTEQISQAPYPFNLRLIRQANQGSAIARNTGAAQAKGHLLIFLDDDMLVEPDYVIGLVEEHKDYPQTVGMGTELPYIFPNPTVFTQIATSSSSVKAEDSVGCYVDFTACVTNNISVEHQYFDEIGKMQDVAGDGPTWWGDVDFGYRAELKGFRFRRSGKAKCYHRDYSIRDLKTASSRAYKAAKMGVALFQKFPNVQSHIPMFHDKTPIIWGQDAPGLIIRKVLRSLTASRWVIGGMEYLVSILEKYYPSPSLLSPLYRWICGAYMFRGYRDGLRQLVVTKTEQKDEKKQLFKETT